MILDEEWLDESLRFDFPDGSRLNGLAGVGGTWVVVRYFEPDGRSMVTRIRRDLFELPSYLHEVPNWIAPAPRYDIDRLNAKLEAALGDPAPLLMVPSYHHLVETMIDNFRRYDITDLNRLDGETVEQTEDLWFLLRTPLFAYRLAEACDHEDRAIREWAVSASDAIERSRDDVQDVLAPATVADNPLVLWGGVMSSGYVTDEEIPSVAAAVEAHLLAKSDEEVAIFCGQAAALLKATLESGNGTGLAVLCHAMGLTADLWVTEEQASGRVGFLGGFASRPDD